MAFPLPLLDDGISFECKEGQASFAADKDRIMAEIGTGSKTVDSVVHGIVAAAAMNRIMKFGNEAQRQAYLEALRLGGVRDFTLSLHDDKATADTTENVTAVLAALSPQELEVCESMVRFGAFEFPCQWGV